jgi:hypothetical protein
MPRTGHFLNRDQFEGYQDKPYSQHYYQYAYSSPTRLVDPTGKCTKPQTTYPGGPVISDSNREACEAYAKQIERELTDFFHLPDYPIPNNVFNTLTGIGGFSRLDQNSNSPVKMDGLKNRLIGAYNYRNMRLTSVSTQKQDEDGIWYQLAGNRPWEASELDIVEKGLNQTVIGLSASSLSEAKQRIALGIDNCKTITFNKLSSDVPGSNAWGFVDGTQRNTIHVIEGELKNPSNIIHELGHIVDWNIGAFLGGGGARWSDTTFWRDAGGWTYSPTGATISEDGKVGAVGVDAWLANPQKVPYAWKNPAEDYAETFTWWIMQSTWGGPYKGEKSINNDRIFSLMASSTWLPG